MRMNMMRLVTDCDWVMQKNGLGRYGVEMDQVI